MPSGCFFLSSRLPPPTPFTKIGQLDFPSPQQLTRNPLPSPHAPTRHSNQGDQQHHRRLRASRRRRQPAPGAPRGRRLLLHLRPGLRHTPPHQPDLRAQRRPRPRLAPRPLLPPHRPTPHQLRPASHHLHTRHPPPPPTPPPPRPSPPLPRPTP